jgi:pSer/pThr/pTyr-binding forkhead associated (FHA) protein
MRDGRTHKVRNSSKAPSLSAFLARHRACIVVLSGDAQGSEFALDREHLSLGRGPRVDVIIDDPTVSMQHALLEFSGDGFRIRDLGSTNGTSVNGAPTRASSLKHGDRFRIGDVELQLVIEPREAEPPVYSVSES